MRQYKKLVSALVLCLLCVATASMGNVGADTLQSTSANYGVSEVQFGSGSIAHSCDTSNDLCSYQSLGDTAVGNSKSATYQVQAGGPVTDRQPYLEFAVANTNINIGVLTSSSTKVAVATFAVKTYLAGGYTVATNSPPPQNGSYTLKTLNSPQGPSIGNEQFGMNLVANTCPSNTPPYNPSVLGSCPNTGGVSNALGANQQQLPDTTFGFGYPTSNYSQANKYMYHQGDIIAKSDSSSGTTLFTISYIFNTSDVTPGGTYTMNQVLVATSTF